MKLKDMEDSDTQEQIKLVAKAIKRMLQELRLEVISRSGLVPHKSYVGNSSTFDILWEVASAGITNNLIKLLTMRYNNLDEAIQECKDKFIDIFMTLHHEHIVKPLKFNWN